MKCKICKREFEIGRLMIHVKKIHNIVPEVYYCTHIGNISEQLICPICNQPRRFAGFKDGYFATCGNRTCSSKLANIRGKEKQIQGCIKRNQKWKEEIDPETGLSKQQLIVRKGEERRSEVREDTSKKQSISMKKRGEDGLTQIERTMIEKYGVKNAMELEDVKKKVSEKVKQKMPQTLEKMKKTCLEKFGVNNFAKTEKRKKLYQELNKNKMVEKIQIFFKENDLVALTSVKNYVDERSILSFKCLKCSSFYTMCWNSIQQYYSCKKCNGNYYKAEKEIADFLTKHNIQYRYKATNIITNPETKRNLELDFYIPSLNIAIEFDGFWWHCSKNGKNERYHLTKTELCEEKNIRLIHIFEDEWIFKRDIVYSRLKNILGTKRENTVFARNCVIHEISSKEKAKFLEENHIQSNDTSSVKLALKYEEKIVSLMTFSRGSIAKGVKPQKGIWELSRFCNKINYHIPGAASKLLSYFQNNFAWSQIYSYADRRWSWKPSNLYLSLGFTFIRNTQPNYFYVHTSRCIERIHRFNFRKSVLRKMGLDCEQKTERQIMEEQGYATIHDCGHLKFELLNKKC